MALSLPSRDVVTTINQDGSRNFLHPADAHGRFTEARRLVAVLVLGAYVLLPWIKINGYPAVFLDVAERRFHLFGLTFAPQDLWLMFFLITGLGFTLFYVTALFGRLWCGWACPQTILLEHVYRRVERWIEGSAQQQRQLDAQSWTAPKKLFYRGAKVLVFLFLSAVIAHLFLAYFVSIPQLYGWMRDDPAQHWSAFLFVAALSGLLYFNFAWFREQFCLILCPYGRLQSALTDDDTLVIGYDSRRGEPRGKSTEPAAGACINCLRCVQVCPTGIDIRQGFQIECIGCAGCIDACNEVMDKLGRPRGLVRYDSLNGLNGKRRRVLRPRLYLYTVLLLIGAAAALFSFSTLRPVDASIVRMGGQPYFITTDTVRNQFNLRLINKHDVPLSLHFALQDAPAGLQLVGTNSLVILPPGEETVLPMVLQEDRGGYTGPENITLLVSGADKSFTLPLHLEFLGPDARLLREDTAPSSAP
jgi:cytochrome c oxidase accessory protein FixG